MCLKTPINSTAWKFKKLIQVEKNAVQRVVLDLETISNAKDKLEDYIDAYDDDIKSLYQFFLRESKLLDDDMLFKLFEDKIRS